MKAIYRAAKACFELGKFVEVVRWCDHGLVCDAGSASLLELRSGAVKQQVLCPVLCKEQGSVVSSRVLLSPLESA